jgi:adenylate cyclase
MDFGVGIVTGEAIVGNIGTRELFHYTAVGDTVNLAQRLEEIAGGGEILMAEATYEALDGMARVEDKGVTVVRGRSEPVAVYALLGMDDQERAWRTKRGNDPVS